MNILKTKARFVFLFLMVCISVKGQIDSDFIPYRKGDLFGYSDTNMKILIPPAYTRADFFYNGMAQVCKGNKYGFINTKGELIIPIEYDYNWERPARFGNGLGLICVIQEHGGFLYGYINKSGKVVQKAELFFAENFFKGAAFVQTNEGANLLLDSNLHVLKSFVQIEPVNRDFPPYKSNELYQVICEDGGTGLVDKKGKMLIPCDYENFGWYTDGVFINSLVREGNYFGRNFSPGFKGVINIENKLLVPFEYYDFSSFKEGMARVRRNEKYGYVNKAGKEVIPCLYDYPDEKQLADRIYEELPGFCEGYVKACLDTVCGFLDKEGKVVIPFKYKHVSSFKEDRAKFVQDGKIGFIDKQGKEIIKAKYDEAGHFYNACAWVKKDGKWGYIDKMGNEIFPLVNTMLPGEAAVNFKEGFVLMRKGFKLAFFNRKAKALTEFIYDDASDFEQGLARVSIRGLWGMIDTTGKIIIPIQYNSVNNIEEGLIRVKDRRQTGFYNRQGKIVLPALYELDFIEWKNGFMFTMRHNKKGYYQKCYVDKKGRDYSEDD